MIDWWRKVFSSGALEHDVFVASRSGMSCYCTSALPSPFRCHFHCFVFHRQCINNYASTIFMLKVQHVLKAHYRQFAAPLKSNLPITSNGGHVTTIYQQHTGYLLLLVLNSAFTVIAIYRQLVYLPVITAGYENYRHAGNAIRKYCISHLFGNGGTGVGQR